MTNYSHANGLFYMLNPYAYIVHDTVQVSAWHTKRTVL